MISKRQHWDSVFSGTENSDLGWHEKEVSKTIELLNHIPNWQNATIFLPGAGTSVLIDTLLDKGAKLVLNDISIEALRKVKAKFGVQNNNLYWLRQDISKPIYSILPDIEIWVDRAVLHFLNDEDDIKGYFKNVTEKISVGGYVLFAEFSKIGASKCAGLPVHQYDVRELSDRLGSFFTLKSYSNFTYINPDGDQRPYIYALFKREK